MPTAGPPPPIDRASKVGSTALDRPRLTPRASSSPISRFTENQPPATRSDHRNTETPKHRNTETPKGHGQPGQTREQRNRQKRRNLKTRRQRRPPPVDRAPPSKPSAPPAARPARGAPGSPAQPPFFSFSSAFHRRRLSLLFRFPPLSAPSKSPCRPRHPSCVTMVLLFYTRLALARHPHCTHRLFRYAPVPRFVSSLS
ncbi:hypothetical protein Hsar01_00013 [Haloferula sargassicola]|uniref:Uncharacterized protein n=1 Tax=Haloferula sargassicola TaxID=490096 RepID=A0ABP9ULA7_9BACT